MKFGSILKNLRKEQRVSGRELSKYLTCSINSIYDWEHNRCVPSLDILSALADFFECTIDYLVGREDDFGIVAVKSDLSEEEKELVSCFSKMDDIQKRAILMTARSFAKNKTEDLLSTK